MNTDVTAKIKMLKSSQECLVCGLLSLLALVGVPFAILAVATREDAERGFTAFCYAVSILSLIGVPFALATMVTASKVRRSETKYWNAARPYRILGGVCAVASLVSAFLVGTLLVFLAANSRLFGT